MDRLRTISRATIGALTVPLALAAACSLPDHGTTAPPPVPNHTATASGFPSGDGAPTTNEGDDDGTTPITSTAPTAQATDVARNFASAWARPDLPAATWLAGIRPYTAPHYATLLATVDPANIPANAITGPPIPVSSTTTVLIVDVPTDTGTLRITCDNMAGQWLVVTTEWKTA